MTLDAGTGSAAGRAAMVFHESAGRAPIVSPPDAWTAAAANGGAADRALIAAGAVDEEYYLRALGEHLGVAFEPLDDLPRRLCPLADERLIEAARSGLLPVGEDDDLTLVVAPRGTAARRIQQLIESNAALARRFRFTSAARFNHFVLRYAGRALAIRATERLHRQSPALSAAPPRRRSLLALALLALVLPTGTLMLTPPPCPHTNCRSTAS